MDLWCGVCNCACVCVVDHKTGMLRRRRHVPDHHDKHTEIINTSMLAACVSLEEHCSSTSRGQAL